MTEEQKKSYLNFLKFDDKFIEKAVYKYITNVRFVILIILTILLAGVSSYLTLPRRLNPQINIPIVIVSSVLPGAGPEDIESLVTIPLEDEIDGLDGIDTLSSTSSENVSTISIEFSSSVNGEEAEKDVQAAVDKVALPEDATDPIVELIDFEDEPIWRFAVLTDNSDISLQSFSKQLEEKIEDLSIVDRVTTTGLLEDEVAITLDQQKITDFGINPISLTSAISQAVDSVPVGNAISSDLEIPVSLDAAASDVADLRQIQLNVDGQIIALGDIADVQLKPVPATPKAYIAQQGESKQVVVLSVYKKLNSDILQASEQVKELVDQEISAKNGAFEVLSVEDNAKDIDDQFDELFNNFSSTIALVFITLLVFLGIRQALIVAFSIPLTFLISMTVMNVSGLSLNFLTLFSLLLALGLLVDDAIVIVSAMTSYYRTKKFSSEQAGMLVWNDFIVPIWSTTITTVWAFAPLLLSTGIIGEFIKGIPIVVSATLIASTSVAVLITLPLMIIILEPKIAKRVKILFGILGFVAIVWAFIALVPSSPVFGLALLAFFALIYILYKNFKYYLNTAQSKVKGSRFEDLGSKLNGGLVNTQRISKKYQNFIEKILSSKAARAKTVIAVIIFSLFSYTLVPLGFVKNEFFPASDFDLIFINLELPQGTKLEKTTFEAEQLLQQLKNEPHVDFVLAEMARSVDPNEGGGGSTNNNASFSLRLVDESERPSSIEIAKNLREKYDFHNEGDISVIELTGGPPAGADIQIKLLGDDLVILDQFATDVKNYLDGIEGVESTSKSIKAGASKLNFEYDNNFLQNTGVNVGQIGLWLRTYTNGFDLGEIRLDQDETDIKLRVGEGDWNASSLGSIQIPVNGGSDGVGAVGINNGTASLPLESFGKFTLEPNPTRITRENGKRTISVSAGIGSEFNLGEINAELEAFADSDLGLPTGYSWQTGGVNEENNRSVQSILQAMVLSAILILVTMVMQLGSFRKAVIVLMVIPLAISGVFINFSLTGTPLSFPALIGILALFGIVVNNSIVVVEKINQNLNIGMDLKDAVSDAAAGRLEPIFFSSLTTIIGLIPITISDPLWRGLGGAIISGLTFSGIIMLLFIPVVYFTIYNHNENNTNR